MRRVLLSALGWLLVLVGLVLYPLPGPGLLVMVIGIGLLGRYDPWAGRRLEPLRSRALVETRRSVATWPRTILSAVIALALGVSGLVWLAEPAQPTWWTLPAWTWFPGGLWAGVGQIVSGAVALAVVVWARVALGPSSAGASDRDMNTLSGSGR